SSRARPARAARGSTSSSPRTASGTSSRCCGTSCSPGSGSSCCSRPSPATRWRGARGARAQSFNEMAAALEAKIEELQAAQARERRFTADVAHELRTPLTALVGEASLLNDHLDRMPAESRRPAELLIADV